LHVLVKRKSFKTGGQTVRCGLIVLFMMLGSVSSAIAQVSIGIGLPGGSIGINLSLYPELVRVPGYPVYYAPRLNSNFFFYDGLYWVYQNDNWYASSWYNGPWGLVAPEAVPLFVLRIPVRYYRNPPGYFRGWRSDAPPRWGEHWGNDWQQRRSGWDRWNRNAVPAPAPLPLYQRQFSGNQYPQQEQQRDLHGRNYRYQPRDAVVRQHYQEQAVQRAPVPAQQRGQQGAPQDRRQRGGEDVQRSTPGQAPSQQRGPAMQEQHQQSLPPGRENAPQGKGASQEEKRGRGQDKDRDRGEEQGQGQDRNRNR
jgi:hypothetical protein